MSESRRIGFRVAASIGLVLGLMMFLIETRSTGEAPETFKVFVSSGPVAIVGAAIVVLAAAALVVLYLGERKRVPRHS